MTAGTQTICEHCGAVGANMFSNDGSHVCQKCYAYDTVVAGELRASQVDLGLTASGDALVLETSTAKAWHGELATSIVFGLLAIVLFAYGIYDQNAAAYVAGSLTALIAIPLAFQAARTLRFARDVAPRIVERASSAPPPQLERPART